MASSPPQQPLAEASIRIDSHLDGTHERSLADDVLDGLTRPFKELPPKHFYDARGAELFDQICDLPEYYPTRVERAILEERAEELARLTGAVELVELGSGTAAKTRVLLDALYAAGTLERYIPVDVTESMVRDSARALTNEYPGLRVHGVIGDFERHLDRVPPAAGPRVVVFLGGTIGNFPPGSRRRFLRQIAGLLGPSDHLLMGTDLVKDPRVLEAAYDDSQGVTAEFNRNVLRVLCRPTSTPRTSTTWRCSTSRTSGSRCACARAASTPRSCATWICRCTSTSARSCAPRSAPSSRPTASPATCRRRGSSSCAG